MAILDSKGRLFGKISILDIGAALIILMVVAGIFLFPGTSGSVAQVGSATKPIEVDVMVRGLTVRDPQALLRNLQEEEKTRIIIRNQPYGEVDVLSVQSLPRSVAVPQPDGTVISRPDPRPELDYTIDMLVTLGGNAQILEDGPVLGNTKIKVGTPMELEGQTYRFNAPVVGVRILDN
ncbi:pyruvate/2-oxoglutarate dehydrogenase complex,dihydrolipoamide dehydrogenase (E3) component [filamentous cyanobacterium CCP1]|nr:pyruvate/2-oxoglutarate dehydrogenase complex,dihydrolipoamide dehydrogenase (E3) component [filamentous cyanobacterium CCP2]PSB62599.1 pyruvate/2-oxoglutarate dehydrogenase complex,dihydrolipoamide dehydrogenase (E3) component [filamentous cyanobacterium CCP1]